MADTDPRRFDQLLFSRHAAAPYTSARTLERDAAEGDIRRVRAGVFAGAAAWDAASDRERALIRTAAVVGTRRDRVVLSHESAALMWGLPRIGRWPETIELADVRGTRPRSRNGIAWRRTPLDGDEVVEIHGFLVTGLEQTLVDLTRSRSFLNAVPALDAALAPYIRNDDWVRSPGSHARALVARLDELGRLPGVRSARESILFADPRSESVGESLSRGQFHLLGFPPPELQVEFDRADGGVDRVDFDWQEYQVFGEFDGDAKYLDPRFRRGRTIEQVILDEKKRADGICRRHRRTYGRWDWKVARSSQRLSSILIEAGLPRPRRLHAASVGRQGVGSRQE